MIIKAKSYFATPFFMDVRKIAGSCCACPRMTTKTQGTCSRYARRKHRASAKVLAAADVAVKLATAWQTKYSPLKKYLMIIIKRFVT
jgi:hypothetical protein